MKTAEEYYFEATTVRTVHDAKLFNLDTIKQIQLDAYRAGMTEAAEICENNSIGGHGKNGLHNRALNRAKQAILSARDKKETI